jgi:methionine-rich copper-binding protein CopC
MCHRAIACLGIAGALLCAGATAAFAHAFLDHAEPAVGSTVAPPPAQIRLWFTEALEPAFSTIAVEDEAGAHREQGKAAVDAHDATLLQVGLPPLPPGSYKVIWRVISVDTHPTEGNFSFTVKP